MIKTRLIRIICLVVAFTSVFCLFDGFTSTPVVADTVDDIEVLDEKVDPKHYQFVGRLYSIILRKDNCDPAEKEKLARKLISMQADIICKGKLQRKSPWEQLSCQQVIRVGEYIIM